MATVTGVWGESYEVDEPITEPTNAIPEIVSEVTDPVTPTVVEPVVEAVVTPSAEETITEPIVTSEPVAEVITPQPEIKEVIKEVEKIVEKYPEMDDYTKELFDALMEGKEDVLLNYLSEKHKDFKTMSDYDVVKENLKKSNPTWTLQEIDLEINYKYGDKLAKVDLSTIDRDIEPEEYREAVRHNKEVEQNEILLKRDARDARIALEQTRKDIKLPKIEKAETINEQVPTGPTEEEIQQGRLAWESLVNNEVPKLKEFSFKVGDDENGHEDVVYNITDGQRAEQSAFLRDLNFDKLVDRLGWVDKEGQQNVSKMAGDVLKLEAMQQLIQSAYTQGRTAGSKGTIGEIKNIDLINRNPSAVPATQPDIGSLLFGHLNPK